MADVLVLSGWSRKSREWWTVNCGCGFGLVPWLQRLLLSRWHSDVATLTEPYRERRARELRAEGHRRRDEWREHCEAAAEAARYRAAAPDAFAEVDPLPAVGNAGLWHVQRARGQVERFERVEDCRRETTVEIHCEGCGTLTERGARCRTALVCESCRGKIGYEKRAKLATNRRVAIDLAAKRGLLRHRRRGGRWSEKLVTVTMPHFAELGILERIDFARETWRRFARGWARWLNKHPDASTQLDAQGKGLARWYRNMEWTPGDDGDSRGHPHFHMWVLCPFLPGAGAKDDSRENVIRNLWRAALCAAAKPYDKRAAAEGRPTLGIRAKRTRAKLEPWEWREVEGLPATIVDVRACKAGESSLREVIKYLFKDFDRGEKLDPAIWALVFEGFDGRRTTQGSRGLMSLALREDALRRYVVATPGGELREVRASDFAHADPHVVGAQDGRTWRLGGCACGACGAMGKWKLRLRPMTDAERGALTARAPLQKARTSVGLPFAAAFANERIA